MIELFNELNIDDSLIYYLQASTPQNSEEYFIDTSFEKNHTKIICCAKSHCRAIEYATKPESPEYSIILEDDAAFHKTDFIKIVQEIISKWEQYFNHCHYVSLGWVPVNNYDSYKLKRNMTIQSITDINDKIIFLNDFFCCGLQCYMVKKNKIKEISQVLNKSSYNDFKKALSDYIIQKRGENFNGYSVEAVDYFLNRMARFEIIFPPLVIEQNETVSLLGHNNFKDYWSKFFKGHEEEIKNYITY
jgi:GR25 family glycosyltransferase involved in LPS biosynthesis